ncbi:MAG: hypothetical protein CM1200mP4_5380 [Rhodospirillaceae bacterium]|nr:MAG: hypothetical protein CM1200mP4_5380 [Rhodospirillaceae bacterium]
MQQNTPADRNKLPIREVLASSSENGFRSGDCQRKRRSRCLLRRELPRPSLATQRSRFGRQEHLLLPTLTIRLKNILGHQSQRSGRCLAKGHFNALICINMVHISPWQATEALFSRAKAILTPESPIFLYGPYTRPNVPTAASNVAFDKSLKERNPLWGLRSLEDVSNLAKANGFWLEKIIEMPANNLSILFRLS